MTKIVVPIQPPVGEITGGVIVIPPYQDSHELLRPDDVEMVLCMLGIRITSTALWKRHLLSFASFHFLGELWQDGQGIPNDTEVGNREDGRVLIFVDGDDVFGAFHTGEMLDGAADTTGNVERWFYGFAGLSNLVAVGQPASIDDGASCAGRTTEGSSKFLHQVEIFGFAQAASTADDDAGVFQGWAFARYLDAFKYLDRSVRPR